MLLDQAVRQLVVLVKQVPPRLVAQARKLLRRVDNVGEQAFAGTYTGAPRAARFSYGVLAKAWC